jgi:predicted AlkP superfamily pyrophosphatase or phosphodiesterase
MAIVFLCLFVFFPLRHAGAARPTVLLVSIDGFGWNYFEKGATPNLRRIAAEGVQAKSLIPVFPTQTFPSHYSMVTGLYPERHGIVGNTMRDPSIARDFRIREPESLQNTNWWLGEPIWITAQKQGLISATCFWPGTDVIIAGHRPTYWLPFDATMPDEKRIAQIIAWLSLPEEKRPQFLTLYFGDVDKAGHRHGPDSPQVSTAIEHADRMIGMLLQRLESIGGTTVNMIIVSDHGMTPISVNRLVALDDYVDLQEMTLAESGEFVSVIPNPGKEEAILRKLRKVPHVTFYRRKDIPERLHFRNSRRIAPIIGIPEEGWMIFTRSFLPEWEKRNVNGMHGYDNQYKSMHGIFVARGPEFRRGELVEPFLNLHIYELIAKILQIQPAPNDGSLDVVKGLLRNSN